MIIFSGIGYGVWVIAMASLCGTMVLSGIPCRPECARPGFREAGTCCAGLAMLFMIPPGSLPPFLNIPWNGALLAGCLLVAACLSRRKAAVLAGLSMAVICCAFFWYARQRGMPGSPANMGTFAAMPVWMIASLPDAASFTILGAGGLLAVRGFLPDRREAAFSAGTLVYLATGALFVSLFLPWNTAPFVSWSSPIAAGVDFLFFWAKAMACCSLASRIPSRGWHARAGLALSIAGALLPPVLSR